MKKITIFTLSFFACAVLFAQHIPTIVGGKGVSATLTAEGNVYAWGINTLSSSGNITKGILGVGSTNQNVPTPTKVNFPSGVSIKYLGETSGFYFLAVSCDGNVYAWGDNSAGQLGNGNATAQAVPVPVKVLLNSPADIAGFRDPVTGNLRRISKVCAGGSTSYAITDDGRLLSWGCNSASCDIAGTGLLGNGESINSSFPVFVLDGATSLSLRNVLQVSAGDQVALALVDEKAEGLGRGTVYSWGTGTAGTLGRNAAGTGNNKNEVTSSNVARPVLFATTKEGYNADGKLSRITSIATADVAGYALDTAGFVWSWGNGGFGGVTGQGMTVTHSDPRKVLKGVATGIATDGKYLLAKSISAGLGFAAAVGLDGQTVAWGNNACSMNSTGPASSPNFACAGNLGNNGLGTEKTDPVYVQNASSLVDNDVLYVSCTNFGGYYIRANNAIWAWGDNIVGQLGDGTYTTRNKAIQFATPTGNSNVDPSPFANILQKDTSICASKLQANPIILKSGLNVDNTLLVKYKFSWYKNDTTSTPVKQGTGLANATYSANVAGTYFLKVEYVGSMAPCGNFHRSWDRMTISTYTQTFTAPTNLTYCGTLATLRVNSTVSANSQYRWYTTPTATTPVATSTGSNTVSFDPSAITALGNGDKIVYVEEKYSAKGVAVPVAPSTTSFNDGSASIVAGTSISSSGSDMYFYVAEDIVIDTISINARTFTGTSANFDFQVAVYGGKLSCGGKYVADRTNVLALGSKTSLLVNSMLSVVKIPVGISLKGGAYYFLGLTSNLQGTIRSYTGVAGMTNNTSDLASNTPFVDNINGTILKVYGTDEIDCYPSAGAFGAFFNWQFSVAQKYCDRLPVILKLNCPCSAPGSVTIQSTPVATGNPKSITATNGNTVTLSGAFVSSGIPAINGMSYSWYKKGTVPVYSATPIVNKILNSTADNGTWMLRVEDGTFGNKSCYKEDSIQVTFSIATDVENSTLLETTSVFPNPFKDELIVNGQANAGARLKLLDAKGTVVLERELVGETESVSTINLPVGVYFVQLLKNGQLTKYKLAKVQ